MKKKYNILSIIIVTLSVFFSSCDAWLDVKPEDRIMEEELFSDLDGFRISLNGIYSSINNTHHYGRNLSFGMLDVMAQYYDCTTEQHTFGYYMTYNYESASYQCLLEETWTSPYIFIANLKSLS